MPRAKSKTPQSSSAAPDGPRLNREDASASLGIAPELFDSIAGASGVEPDPDGRYDPFALAIAAIRHAEAADRRVSEVGAALSEVKPALERLATLPDRAALAGDSHTRAMVEVAAFFNAFAAVMNRATAALRGEDGG